MVFHELIFPLQQGFQDSKCFLLENAVMMLCCLNFLDMNPAGLHVCPVGPCLYIAPTPDTEASQITHIGSSNELSMGRNIAVLQQIFFMFSKQA
jgi:hypothetical protein